MRTLSAVLAMAVAVAVWTAPPAAQAKVEQKGVVLIEQIQDLNLTDTQEAKIADIRKEYRPKVQEAAKELAGVVKEEVEKVQAVLTPQQREKLQTLKEERQERREDCLAHRIANLRDLDLTDAEMTALEDLAAKKDLNKTAVIRQALRLYQMVDQRLREGKKVFIEDEMTKAKSELMLL